MLDLGKGSCRELKEVAIDREEWRNIFHQRTKSTEWKKNLNTVLRKIAKIHLVRFDVMTYNSVRSKIKIIIIFGLKLFLQNTILYTSEQCNAFTAVLNELVSKFALTFCNIIGFTTVRESRFRVWFDSSTRIYKKCLTYRYHYLLYSANAITVCVRGVFASHVERYTARCRLVVRTGIRRDFLQFARKKKQFRKITVGLIVYTIITIKPITAWFGFKILVKTRRITWYRKKNIVMTSEIYLGVKFSIGLAENTRLNMYKLVSIKFVTNY